MRILSVNASVAGGGAERVARTLNEAYRARGHDALLAVANVNAPAEGVVPIPVDAGRSAWARRVLPLAWSLSGPDRAGRGAGALLSRALRVIAEPGRWARVARGHEDFDFPWTAGLLDLVTPPPDIIHLHNLHGGYFDIRALPAISARVPTVLTLHDAWALSGHCAQPLECGRWRAGCGSCPDLRRYVPIRRDASAENHALKHAALASSRLAVATPSAWLLDLARESGIIGERSEARVIPNGVDTRIFAPGDRAAARADLGLPHDRTIVMLVGGRLHTDPLKGFDTFASALLMLPHERLADLLVLALGDVSATGTIGGAEVRGVPFADDPATVAAHYRAADVFVHPSHAENLPMAVIEAMACGLPVVATDVGGTREAVSAGTGRLVSAGDAAALAVELDRLLGDAEARFGLGAAGAARVRERFDLDRQVAAYLAWYEQLIERARATEGELAQR